MKSNFKKLLNEEFDKKVSNFNLNINTPISQSATVKKQKFFAFKFLLSSFLLAAIMIIASTASKDILNKASNVTCVIVDVSPQVQIVVDDDVVISVDAIDSDAAKIVDKVGKIEGQSFSTSVDKIIGAALELGYLEKNETVKIDAINNNRLTAKHYIDSYNYDLEMCESKYDLKINTGIIDYNRYNAIAFEGENLVDNLDQDLDIVLKADKDYD